MLLWILMALLTAAASLAVLVPLGRSARMAAAGGAAARSIYRDQLGELARDRERGLIGEPEAEAARVELSRRLLRSEEAGGGAAAPRVGARKVAVLVAVALIPIASLATYLAIGSPNLPDQPFASRGAEGTDAELAVLVARVEQHLAADPEDGSGWEVLGPVYMRQGRFADAARAFDQARRLLGSTPDRDALFGEAVTRAHGDVVTVEAREAFDRALAAEPGNVRALYYRAVWLGQSGRKDEAVAAWNALIGGAPAGAPWLPSAKSRLAALEGVAPAEAPRGPSAEDVASAAAASPEERSRMIEGMVSGLAARLDAAPGDVGGWARLFRAYIVLGRPGDARAALDRARIALAGEPDALAAVEEAARENGVGGDQAKP